jgi:hypothetical protein
MNSVAKPAVPGQVSMPNMGKQFTLTLDSLDVGQLLDGLRAREESWRKIAEYLETGYSADDSFICEECHGPSEAEKIAEHYGRIIKSIERQIEE